MKTDAVLINIARGPIVDEVPFWAALQGEKIGLGLGAIFVGVKGCKGDSKHLVFIGISWLMVFLWDLRRIFIKV